MHFPQTNLPNGTSVVDQGEIWWTRFPEPSGRRPVVILTRSHIISKLTDITIAPCTTSLRPIRTRARLTTADGLPVDCDVNLDNIQTIDKRRLEDKIVRLRSERMAEIFAAIRAAFDMP